MLRSLTAILVALSVAASWAHPMMMSSSMLWPPPFPLPYGDSFPMPPWGTSVSNQGEGEGLGDVSECDGVQNYIAKSFNVNRFSMSTSYHDVFNFATLFVEEGTGLWNLYDFPAGRIYTYNNGICTYYYRYDAAVTGEEFGSYMDPNIVPIDNFLGYNAYSYQAPMGDPDGSIMIKGVINSLCVEALTYMAVNDRIITLAIHQDFQVGDSVTATINQQIDAARAQIAGTNCQQIYG